MAVTGENTENKDMRMVVKALSVNGGDITTQYTDADAEAAIAGKTEIAALVSPATDYANLAAATAAIKSIIDALKA